MIPNNNDRNEVEKYFDIFQRLSQNYMDQLKDQKVAKLDVALEAASLSDAGLSLAACVRQLETEIIPQLSAQRGPRYWGFVTGGATPIATMADWLVSTFDQNLAKAGDSIADLVERQAIEWLCELFLLPVKFKGLMSTGATASNFLGACLARQFAGTKQNIDVAKQGVYDLDVDIFCTTPHASMVKSLGMAGLGQNNFTQVQALHNSEAMNATHLQQLLEQSSAKAIIVIASAGTVTTTDFDDLVTISALCKKHDAWLHVDAAFGLFERLLHSNEQTKTRGIESADSITLDCHKWLNVPYDCGVFLTPHLQLLEDSFDVPAPYLLNHGNEPDFMSIGIENSRRFRAFPVWLSLLAYGREGIRAWVESNIRLAGELAQWIDLSADYELVHPCQLNVVLFRPNCVGLDQQNADQKTAEALTAINQDGRLFLSPGKWQGNSIIRIALSNWQTTTQDIEIAKQVLSEIPS